MPRLTLAEWKACGRAAGLLAAADQSLQRTNWGGSPSVRAAVAQAYELLAALFNKAEPSAIKHQSLQGPKMLDDDDVGGLPGRGPGQPAMAVPGDQERKE
jgi:hypothetical protein